jgi:hypothetical protein
MKKNIIVIFIVSFFFFGFSFFVKQTIKGKVKLTYLGYEINRYRFNYQNFNFEILNNTNDKIYLSETNIFVSVTKEGKPLKEDKNESIGTPYVRPVINKGLVCIEQREEEEKKYSLKVKFANKLYQKNFGFSPKDIDTKKGIIDHIVSDCIVLMPNESINYSRGFHSKIFDKSCKVSVKYIENKRFNYFLDDNGKKININNY